MDNLLSTDPGKELLIGLVSVMKLKLAAAQADPTTLSAAEMAAILKLLSDNSITLAAIQRGDFGGVVKRVEEEFPFPEGGTVVSPVGGFGRA